MIGIDTNVLVRYLAKDDAKQSPVAATLLEKELSIQNPGFVSLVTMLETAWVLLKVYQVGPVAVAESLLQLVRSAQLVFENENAVIVGLIAMRDGDEDYADAMIGFVGTQYGCSTTLTFDKRASRNKGFTLLKGR